MTGREIMRNSAIRKTNTTTSCEQSEYIVRP